MSNMFLLARYDPVVELLAQEACEQDLDTTLDELLGFVLIADMPAETRKRLMSGLAHARRHIKGQTRQLKSEIVGRNC